MGLILDLTKRYTYADYLTWLDNTRRELIDGFVKLMSPAPSDYHQSISSNVHGIIWSYLINNNCTCKVRHAPFDVRFLRDSSKDEKIYDVVQPDLCVICDVSKLDDKGCVGAPDLIVEILSKTTYRIDTNEKYNLYEKNGVKEYWVISPKAKLVTVHTLGANGVYNDGEEYVLGEKIPISLFHGFEIDTEVIFRK